MIVDQINRDLFGDHGFDGRNWAMTFAEKFALSGILSQRRPAIALEIGTLNGGSLSIISRYSQKVYSIDSNPEVKEKLSSQFRNVTFLTGKSQKVLPDLIASLNESETEVGFALIDGDHTEDGVRRDILEVLNYKPKAPFWLLMHDSFNPDCRKAMKSVDWNAYPCVHWVNYDFIPGFLSSIPGWEDQMWCGMALAYLDRNKREGPLQFGELLGRQFSRILPLSKHAEADPAHPPAAETIP